ncbi:MAG TPA: hypothetical protein PLZ74_04475 [Kiritimatiellia bacterium]|nr:hypothetical protein [Kiritimatiellia bacterium]
MTCEAGSDRVVKWADADSKDIIFSNVNYQALSTPNAATYKTNHINGLSTVYFDHSHIRYLAGGVPCSLRTYFGVVAHGHDATPFGILDGVFGQGGVDAGIRIHNGTSYSDPIALTDRVNGDAGSAFAKGTPHLFSRVYPGNMKWDSPALSDYSPHKRPMSGDICEIVVYGRVLGETERSLVEDYLMAKWGLKNLPDPAKYADVLPTGTDLTVASAATLDLNGNDQTLASLDLSGTLTNSVERVATLTLSGVSFVRAGASFGAPNLDLVLSDDAVLDLGGGTFTIRRLTGRRVQVINGVLNETKPLLDFLLIIR